MKQLQKRIGILFLILALSISAPVTLPDMQGNQTATVVNVEAKKAKYVYITRTGECYHTHKCGNGTYYRAKLKVAKSMGLRKCKKCY